MIQVMKTKQGFFISVKWWYARPLILEPLLLSKSLGKFQVCEKLSLFQIYLLMICIILKICFMQERGRELG